MSSSKKRGPRARCLACKVRRAILADGLCKDCFIAQAREAFLKAHTPSGPLVTELLDLDEVAAIFARGRNHEVLYQSGTALVQSMLDPVTKFEVNRLAWLDPATGRELCALTVTGDTWPDPPLAPFMKANWHRCGPPESRPPGI